MYRLLALAAALAVITSPAQAQHRPQPGTEMGSTHSDDFRDRDRCFDGRAGDRRHSRSFCGTNVVMDWYGGEWALYNNRSWAPDSYNDWWHEEPWRAYPAWMKRSQDCSRQWYSGDTLRC